MQVEQSTDDVEPRFVRVRGGEQKHDVLALRAAVYVSAEGRISDNADFSASFDRYEATAEYIVAYVGARPVGTVKLVLDGAAGLPCDELLDLSKFRAQGTLVEFGHLITLPDVRNKGLGMTLMREAYRMARHVHGATHIFADLFLDKKDTSQFYRAIGFEVVHGPYRDERFLSAPESLLMCLDVPTALRTWPETSGRTRKLLDYFFGDAPGYLSLAG